MRIELLDVTRLRVEDEGVGMLTSLMKNFVPSFDGATHALRGFRFYADSLVLSSLAKKQLLLSFNQIPFEVIQLDGVRFPRTLNSKWFRAFEK